MLKYIILWYYKNIEYLRKGILMKKGFTLAEVLITLAIIGVVAALTIPSVIVKTQQQEFKTGAKKAISVLSQAMQLTEVKDGYTPFTTSQEARNDFIDALMNNMNIVKVDDSSSNVVFYTADGMRYEMTASTPYVVEFIADVNGDKGPSSIDNGYSGADFYDYDDLFNPEWPDVTLSDAFKIRFINSGTSIISPYPASHGK